MRRLPVPAKIGGARWARGTLELWVAQYDFDHGAWRAEIATVIDVTEHYVRHSLRTIAVCGSRSRAINEGMRRFQRECVR